MIALLIDLRSYHFNNVCFDQLKLFVLHDDIT